MIEELKNIFDPKVVDILSIVCVKEKFQIRELAEVSGVPLATTYRIVQKFIEADLVREVRNDTFVYFEVNHANKLISFFSTLSSNNPLQSFLSRAKTLEGLNQVIQIDSGPKSAKIIVVGSGVNPASVKEICTDVASKFDFTIESMQLSPEQYSQWKKWNIGGKKTEILYSANLL